MPIKCFVIPKRNAIIYSQKIKIDTLVSYCHLQHHNDTKIKTKEDFFIKIYTSHFIVRVRKGLLKVCVWESVGDRREISIFWPPLLWPSTLCRSCSPDAQPEALGSTLLGAGFLYCILSATSLVPKLHRGSRGPPRSGVAFPTTSRLLLRPISNWHWNSNCLDFCLDWVI